MFATSGLCLSLSAGVSGPIAFDSKGDLLAHNNSYVSVSFHPKTGKEVFGSPIRLAL
jgi:hypothetical protein